MEYQQKKATIIMFTTVTITITIIVISVYYYYYQIIIINNNNIIIIINIVIIIITMITTSTIICIFTIKAQEDMMAKQHDLQKQHIEAGAPLYVHIFSNLGAGARQLGDRVRREDSHERSGRGSPIHLPRVTRE